MGGAILKLGERLVGRFFESGVGSTVAKDVLESGEHALRRMGPWGEALYKLDRAFETDAAQIRGASIVRLKPFLEKYLGDPTAGKKITEAALAGKSTGNVDMDAAIAAFQSESDRLYHEIKATGVKVAPLLKDYWPKMWAPEVFEGAGRRRSIAHLIASGKAANEYEANTILNYHHPRMIHAPNIERPRTLDLPGHRTDVGVAYDYIERAAKKLAYVRNFGANNENTDLIIGQIAAGGGRANYARFVHEIVTGLYRGGPDRAIANKIMSFEAATKLSRVAIKHLPQVTLHDGLLFGLGDTLRGLARAMAEYGNAKEFAILAGNSIGDGLRQARQYVGVRAGSLGEKVTKYTGLSGLLEFSKVWAASIGKFSAEHNFRTLLGDPANKLARKRLLLLGTDVNEALARGSLTEKDLLTAGKRASDLALLGTSALDIPPVWRTSPEWRMWSYLRQYGFKEARFIKDQVLKPALEGELRPLVFYATVFPAFGEVVADMMALVKGGAQGLADRPKKPLDRYLDDIASAGLFGVWENALYAYAHPTIQPLANWMLGSVYSEALSAYRPVHAAMVGKGKQAAVATGREVVGRVPVAGPLISKKLFPPRAKPQKSLTQKGFFTKLVEKTAKAVEEHF